MSEGWEKGKREGWGVGRKKEGRKRINIYWVLCDFPLLSGEKQEGQYGKPPLTIHFLFLPLKCELINLGSFWVYSMSNIMGQSCNLPITCLLQVKKKSGVIWSLIHMLLLSIFYQRLNVFRRSPEMGGLRET